MYIFANIYSKCNYKSAILTNIKIKYNISTNFLVKRKEKVMSYCKHCSSFRVIEVFVSSDVVIIANLGDVSFQECCLISYKNNNTYSILHPKKDNEGHIDFD